MPDFTSTNFESSLTEWYPGASHIETPFIHILMNVVVFFWISDMVGWLSNTGYLTGLLRSVLDCFSSQILDSSRWSRKGRSIEFSYGNLLLQTPDREFCLASLAWVETNFHSVNEFVSGCPTYSAHQQLLIHCLQLFWLLERLPEKMLAFWQITTSEVVFFTVGRSLSDITVDGTFVKLEVA